MSKDMPMKGALPLLIVFIIVVGIGVAWIVAVTDTISIVAIWLVGAGGLGLLSGYTTGASEKTGSASDFLKFVSGGVLVPLLGGVAALLRGSQKTTETHRYEDGLVVEKITSTSSSFQDAISHPLVVLGGFLLLYSIFAVIGIVVGIHYKTKGFVIKKE